MKKAFPILIACLALLPMQQSEARGRCDGIHGCKCGSTQTRHYHLPRNFNGHNLWRAVEWIHAFPRTIASAGAVVYQRHGGPSGHVSRIVRLTSSCHAIVADDRGEYERDICSRGAVYVDPNENAVQRSIF